MIYSGRVVDLATRQIPTNVVVRACVVTDVDCASPVTPVIPLDAGGWFDVPLYRGFIGYLEFTGPDFVPGVLYLTEPMSGPLALEFPLIMITFDSLDALSGLVGVKVDPTLGMITVRAFDCQGATAQGVVLNKEGAGVSWYFVDGLPSRGVQETGSDGFGGWVNVPPGVVAVDAEAPTGLSISGAQSMVIRPGWFSSIYIWPRGTQPRLGTAMR